MSVFTRSLGTQSQAWRLVLSQHLWHPINVRATLKKSTKYDKARGKQRDRTIAAA
ncbi:MAG: hypothetical protein AB1589_00255 [Cyanobacteriota bacterium]